MKTKLFIAAMLAAAGLAGAQMFAQLFAPSSTARLPEAYQEVSYLKAASAGPIIDTGYSIVGRVWYLKTSFVSPSNPFQGAIYNNAGTYYRCHTTGLASAIGESLAASSLSLSGNPLATNVYEFSASDGMRINGGSWKEFTGTLPDVSLYLFGRHGVGIASSSVGAVVLESTITTTAGDPVQTLIPCYRKADSVAGMYDLVGGTFIVNSGTGSFTAGPDVAQ